MRAKLFAVARRLPGGLLLPLVLALGACETSPTEQLTRAETMFSRLESRGADQYLIYQMAEIRRGIEIARRDIRNNRLELAFRSLHGICERLDSCSTAFMNLRKKAAAESRRQAQGLAQELETIEQFLALLPRHNYIDQNRYDIQAFRLRRYHQELATMEGLIQTQDFQKALSKGDELMQQVQVMLAGFKPMPVVASRKRIVPPQAEPSPPPDKPATSMMATMAR